MSLLPSKRDPPKPKSTFSSYASHATRWSVDILRPALLTSTPSSQKSLSPTSYLDGLRGFAAFLVYCQHHQGWAHVGTSTNTIMESSYGYKNQYYFACLPFIRLFFTGGHVAVCVFFVISGYVLSAKGLKLIHTKEAGRLNEHLASALFRRWLRLFVPAIITTFLYATSWHLFGIWTAVPVHQKSYLDEVVWWYYDFKEFSFVFRGGDVMYSKYNFHLWSIALEFKGSIVIFTSLLAFSRCKKNARLLCEVGLTFYLLCITEGMLYSMFVAGMLLADLEMLAKTDELPAFFYTHLEPYRKTMFYALFVMGIYLSGVPAIDFDTNIQLLQESPGWRWLSKLKPTSVSETDYKWFYLFWASLFLVSSISRINWLKSFFETRLNQYLGRISFSLYLIHGPIIWTLADRLYLAAGLSRTLNIEGLKDWIGIWPLSMAGPVGLEFAFWLPHLVILPITLWLAEICTKLFDKPSIKLAHWAYGKVLTQEVK